MSRATVRARRLLGHLSRSATAGSDEDSEEERAFTSLLSADDGACKQAEAVLAKVGAGGTLHARYPLG
jgi:hypothetical protein